MRPYDNGAICAQRPDINMRKSTPRFPKTGPHPLLEDARGGECALSKFHPVQLLLQVQVSRHQVELLLQGSNIWLLSSLQAALLLLLLLSLLVLRSIIETLISLGIRVGRVCRHLVVMERVPFDIEYYPKTMNFIILQRHFKIPVPLPSQFGCPPFQQLETIFPQVSMQCGWRFSPVL